MHPVCLYVAKNFLIHLYGTIVPTRRIQLNAWAKRVKLPFEFRGGISGLIEVSYFKTIECKIWLLYAAPLILMIWQRNFTICSWNYHTLSDYLLKLLNICQIMNSSSMSFVWVLPLWTRTFNLDSLHHLPWQVTNYWPLWTEYCLAFEWANHSLVSTLCEPFTTTCWKILCDQISSDFQSWERWTFWFNNRTYLWRNASWQGLGTPNNGHPKSAHLGLLCYGSGDCWCKSIWFSMWFKVTYLQFYHISRRGQSNVFGSNPGLFLQR